MPQRFHMIDVLMSTVCFLRICSPSESLKRFNSGRATVLAPKHGSRIKKSGGDARARIVSAPYLSLRRPDRAALLHARGRARSVGIPQAAVKGAETQRSRAIDLPDKGELSAHLLPGPNC